MFWFRHYFFRVCGKHPPDHFRGLWLPGHDGGIPRFSLRQCLLPVDEGDLASSLHTTMAGGAMLRKDRPNIAVKLYCALRPGHRQNDGNSCEKEIKRAKHDGWVRITLHNTSLREALRFKKSRRAFSGGAEVGL